jgi:hypothetical protein
LVLGQDSGTVFTNLGATSAVQFSLPPPAVGENYTFIVSAAQIVTITVNNVTNDTINTNIATLSSSGHTLTAPATAQWSTCKVVCTSAPGTNNTWVVVDEVGPFVLS